MSVPPPINVVAEDPEERSMAALAHASIVLNFFMPGLGVIAAGAVWLTQQNRSVFARKQAFQATVYQIVWLLLPIVMAIVGVMSALGGAFVSAFADARVGVILIPLFVFGILAVVVVVFVGLLYGLVAAYETYQGRDFRYWFVGHLVH